MQAIELAHQRAYHRCDGQGDVHGGQCVKLVGLSARPELNGECGIALRFNAESGRWLVRLADGEGKQLVHECCVRWLKRFREGARNRGIARADRDVVTTASLSGRSRTRPIGIDQHGHTYWLFAAAPGSVFVQLGPDSDVGMELDGPPSDPQSGDAPVAGTGWMRYDDSTDLSRLMKVRVRWKGRHPSSHSFVTPHCHSTPTTPRHYSTTPLAST